MVPHRARLREELERLVEGHRVGRHRLEERRCLRLGLRISVAFPELDVGAETSRFGEHGEAGLWILPDGSIPRWCLEQLGGFVHRELIDGKVLRDRGPVLAVHEVGTVLTAPCHDRHTVGSFADLERVDGPRIDRLESGVRDEVLQPGMTLASRVEPLEVGGHLLFATCDLVEVLFHERGEVVVDVVTEVLLKETDDGESLERRDQSRALLANVAPILNGRDDRRVRRRPADAEFLESLHETRLGVPGRGLRLMHRRVHGDRVEDLPFAEFGKMPLLVVSGGVGIVDVLDIGLQEAGEQDGPAGRRELTSTPADRRGTAYPKLQALTLRVLHLAGDGALPDQVVEPGLIGSGPERTGDGLRVLEPFTGGPDRLMGFLRTFRLLAVEAGRVGQVLLAETICNEGAGRGERRPRQIRRVGAHVGDEPTLVKTLGSGHRSPCSETELASGFLLQGGRAERCVRSTRVRLAFDGNDGERCSAELVGERVGCSRFEDESVFSWDPCLVEVLAGSDPLTINRDELGFESAVFSVRGERAGYTGVRRCDEREPRPLALDDDPRCGRLDPPGREASLDLAPQHRGDLVSEESIEDAPGFLGRHDLLIELSGVIDGFLNRVRGDLVEHHAVDGHLRLQDLQQVPGNRLTLPVLVGREVQSVGTLHLLAQRRHLFLGVGGDDIHRREAVLDVDAEPARLPRVLPGVGHFTDLRWDVADVTDGGFDDEVVSEVAADRPGFRRGLNDDEVFRHEGVAL